MGQKQQIRNRKLKQKLQGEEQLAKVVLQPRSDDLGESFPNDWVEALIIFVAGLGVFGGVIALYHLAQQVQ